MISPKIFYNHLIENNIDFFTGVPDSLLKNLCAYITDNTPKEKNIISANEGGAIALASGYHLATDKIPLVYMQNSGIGNTVNPLLSLADKDVYSIPMLLLVGWRGEPGVKDEPQHIKQGKTTLQIFESMQIPYSILPEENESAKLVVNEALKYINEKENPYVLIIRKNTFETYTLENKVKTSFEMNREQAIKEIVSFIDIDDVVVSTTGMTSRELFEYRAELQQGHHRDFLTVGSMGHANQIALGIALEKPNRSVYCFDGDGAILMHTGSLGIIGDLAPKNFKHIVFNNGAHDSVGGQPTVGLNTDLCKIAKGFNYKRTFKVSSKEDLKKCLVEFGEEDGPSLMEIFVNKGARKDLGRPTISPIENKHNFKKFLMK